MVISQTILVYNAGTLWIELPFWLFSLLFSLDLSLSWRNGVG